MRNFLMVIADLAANDGHDVQKAKYDLTVLQWKAWQEGKEVLLHVVEEDSKVISGASDSVATAVEADKVR